MPTRRQALALGAGSSLAMLAGCSTSDTSEPKQLPDSSGSGSTGGNGGNTDPIEPDPAPEPDPEPAPEPEPAQTDVLTDDRLDIPRPGHYVQHFELFAPHEVHWDIFVRDGNPVNVFFTDRPEFQEYDAGNRFRFYSEMSREEVVSASATDTFGSGDYSLIIDTTRNSLGDYLEDEADTQVLIEITPV
jgi:hypothetical protein